MTVTPIQIYEDLKSKNIDRNHAIESLLYLIENIEDKSIRKNCLKLINSIKPKGKEVFKIIENILISDSDESVRYTAAKIIKRKYLDKALTPFIWALQHESSYDCLLIIIKVLKKTNDPNVKSILIDEIRKIDDRASDENLESFLGVGNIENFSNEHLGNILIDHLTIDSFKNTLNNFKYKTEKGLVVELDFSKVDNKILGWHDRETFERGFEFSRLRNLINLRSLKLFSVNWIIQHDLFFSCMLMLLKSLNELDSYLVRRIFISYLRNIDDSVFNESINDFFQVYEFEEEIPIYKLSNILKNYIVLSFLRKDHPQIKYQIKNGEIVELNIRKTPLIKLSEFIGYFQSISKLEIIDCKLYSIPDTIRSLEFIEILNLEGNNLETIPKSIESLKFLKTLNFSHNRINKLEFSFNALPHLEHLNLEDNKLEQFPNFNENHVSLKLLNLSKNIIFEIPDSITYLTSLQNLNLSSNKIISLPEQIGSLKFLKILNLDRNKLMLLPKSINLLHKLETLSLEDNKLKVLPKMMGELKSINKLNISWNKLISLPSSIGYNTSLIYLDVSHNKLTIIPESIRYLDSLNYLNLASNSISTLPNGFEEFTSLKTLFLNENQLISLPESINLLISLEYLNLWGNHIINLPDSIGKLSSLRELWLNGNQLGSLPESIGNISSLRKLSLNQNKLKKLPNSLKSLSLLEDLQVNWDGIINSSDFLSFQKKK
jgi:Leucine-rich repeat (LRR) protein